MNSDFDDNFGKVGGGPGTNIRLDFDGDPEQNPVLHMTKCTLLEIRTVCQCQRIAANAAC